MYSIDCQHLKYFYFQCLLIGDSEGQVTVLQLRSMPAPPSQENQVYSLFFLSFWTDMPEQTV